MPDLVPAGSRRFSLTTMQRLGALSLFALAAFAPAQCFDLDIGPSIGVGPDQIFAIQPIGFAFPMAGATYTHIHVTDKCYAFLSNNGTPAPATTIDFSATGAELASASPRICALWSDIQGQAANNAGVHLRSTATECTITWRNVQCYQASSGVFSVQMKLFASGEIKFFYGPGTTNQSLATQPTWQAGIVGVSPGGGVALPTSLDLSAGATTTDNTIFEEFLVGGSFDMADNGLHLIPTNPGWVAIPLGAPANCASASNYGTGCGSPALALTTIGGPVLGSTTFTFRVNNVPAALPVSALFFGDTVVNPGVSLAVIGMNGCNAYSNGNLLSLTLPATAGVSSVPLPIPNQLNLIGITMSTQALAFSNATTAGLIASNGNQFTVGN